MANWVGSQLNQHTLEFGKHKVTLYKRSDTIDGSWFFRVHLKGENRFFRKSLKTRDKDEAAAKAHEELVGLLTKINSGQRLLSLSVRDIVRRFSLHCEDLVRQEQLSANTWRNHRYRIDSGIEFLKTHYPDDVKVSNIDGEVFRKYLSWRTEKNAAKGKTIRRDVVRDELLVIRKLFKWAHTERICPEKAIPNWDFHVEKEGAKRERIASADFHSFIRTAFAWVRCARSEKDLYQRRMLLFMCVVVSLSGMRAGEIFGLKMKDVIIQGEEDCLVTIRPETSKIRRSRQIVVPDMLALWLTFTRAKEPNDYVFCGYDDAKTSSRDIFYHLYRDLRLSLSKIGLPKFDFYHCRHWYITNQLYAGQPIHLVAKAAGTSVGEIEQTYSQVLTELTTRQFNTKKVVWKDDNTYKVIKRINWKKGLGLI